MWSRRYSQYVSKGIIFRTCKKCLKIDEKNTIQQRRCLADQETWERLNNHQMQSKATMEGMTLHKMKKKTPNIGKYTKHSNTVCIVVKFTLDNLKQP